MDDIKEKKYVLGLKTGSVKYFTRPESFIQNSRWAVLINQVLKFCLRNPFRIWIK